MTIPYETTIRSCIAFFVEYPLYIFLAALPIIYGAFYIIRFLGEVS